MKRLTIKVSIALTLGLGLTLALLWLLGHVRTEPPVARAASYTVCPAGPPTCDYSTIQDAVDAASDGDVIKVASGTYTGVQDRPVPAGYPSPPDDGSSPNWSISARASPYGAATRPPMALPTRPTPRPIPPR